MVITVLLLALTASLIIGIVRSFGSADHIDQYGSIPRCFPSFLSLFTIVVRKSLAFPILYISAQVFYCDRIEQFADCSSGLHYFLMGISIFNYASFLGIIGANFWLFQDESFESSVPWVLRHSQVELITLVKTIVVAIFLAADSEFSNASILVCFWVLIDGYTIYLHIFSYSLFYPNN